MSGYDHRNVFRGHGGVYRIPTIDEALTYSPLTSIIPFNPEVIPTPVPYTATASLQLVSNERAAAANEILWSLDQEARNAQGASQRLKHTLADVRRLLNPKDLPNFKLKTPAHIQEHLSQSQRGNATETPKNVSLRLGPFAKRLLQSGELRSTNNDLIPSRQRDTATLSPSHAQAAIKVNPQHKATSLQASTTATPQSSISHTSHGPHRPPADANGTTGNPSQVVPPGPIFINNPVLSQEEAAEFEIGTIQEPQIPAQRSQPNGISEQESRPTAVNDQRQRAEVAISRFQMLASDIFEAEIDAQSGNQTTTEVFTTVDTQEGNTIILHDQIQTSLDKSIATLLKYRAFSSIQTDDLSRIQKLCNTTISASDDRYLGVGEGWDDGQVSDWATKMALADQSLVAARTILRIMNSGSDSKRLFSEDIMTTIMDFIRQLVDYCVVPVVELRASKEADSAFKMVSRQRGRLSALFSSVTKVLALLGNLFFNVDMDETAVNSVQSLCVTLIFVENAPTETDSALGVQTFEKLRRTAMDALSKLFARNVNQRQSIFDDILTSLERLPVGRQSARQYKLPDAKPIQLVSALLMRLVQTSAMGIGTDVQRKALQARRSKSPESEDQEEEESEEDADYESDDDAPLANAQQKRKTKAKSSDGGELESVVVPSFEASLNHARYITNFLVSRALNSTKSSGEPYRNLLDIFVEDFINVLGNTDWPAAELLLRQLLNRLYEMTENKHSSAPSKAMALELMGAMLSGITDLRLHTIEAFEKPNDDASLFESFKTIHTSIAADEAIDSDVLSLKGPYRAVLEYLRLRPDTDSNVATALSYHITQWAYQIIRPGGRDSSEPLQTSSTVNETLASLLRDPQNYEIEPSVGTISTEEGRLGAAMVTLRLPVCRLFNKIFNKLLVSMSSDQASLRSKSLRSVEDVLQKDPSILDRGSFVLGNIVRCMTDSSTQVRDAALGLLATCLQLRSKLDINAYEHILRRTTDSAALVRKRAIKLAKDIYLRNDAILVRSKIADALIHCISDLESTVVELARQTMEDIWIAPYHALIQSSREDAYAKTKIAQQASLIVETVRRSPNIALVLQDLLEDVMSKKAKNHSGNIAVCKAFVLLMVDAIVDETTLPSKPPQAATMQTLAILAQARPKLFTSAQVQPLLPYLKNLSSTDDLNVYRYAIIILRCTLPHISNLPQAVLVDTQSSLLGNVSKLPGPELKEVASCLWTLSGMSGSPDKLVVVTRSAMENLKLRASQNLSDEKIGRQAERLLLLVGHFVNAFDLDPHLKTFLDKFPGSRAASVASLAVNVVCPLTGPKTPASIRSTALEALLCICQAWPKQYQREDVLKSIDLVLSSVDTNLELVLMQAWRDFFVPGSDRRPVEDKHGNGAKDGVGAERIEKTYQATDRDGALTSLSQRFTSHMIRIVLQSTGELSSMSAQVVTSINKLGLVHPKETAAALVALETSPDHNIAKMAYEEHSALFSKHESIFDKETVRAVQMAFTYQRETYKDPTGYIGSPAVPKLQLFWDVLKNASAKIRKRFLGGICDHLDFEHGKLDLSGSRPKHVDLAGFCAQNLALFDYTKHEDLMILVEGLEKVCSSTGTSVAHGIEAVLMNRTINGAVQGEEATNQDGVQPGASVSDGIVVMDGAEPNHATNGTNGTAITNSADAAPIDPQKLRELTAGAQILTLLWELRTYIRRVYSMIKSPTGGGQRGRPPNNPKPKDQTRAPQRVPNAAYMTERFLARTAEILSALESEAESRELCLHFQRLMSIDDEVKVKTDGDGVEDALLEDVGLMGFGGGGEGGPGTPSGDEESVNGFGAATPGKRGRKRKSSTPGNTPRKKRAGSKGRGVRRSVGFDEDEDGDWN